MDSLIIYGGKYGTTEDCAQKVAAQLDGEVVVSAVKDFSAEDLAAAKRVIVGTSIYAGSLNKEVADLLLSKRDLLLQKDFAFFVCGMRDYEESMNFIRESFDPELLQHAQAYAFLGGQYQFDKMNFFEKQVIKMVTKKEGNPVSGKENVSSLSEERLAAFINQL
ncbi:flavodoxin domain-containing protein [Culicoidibacter larvae]|uniref:Flavodoxin-like domain-containing protein n=1 Tax=Culicoidibacter larvae TaxID=2579976 RepID=A0A5R8QB80_9FIRM|nr:flavodoxin domain-containing protein [Culicoidibacter larvae]TLG73839.1 hypothetical protein FEZ08_06810 [Culicoidibacter larvae]